MKFIMRLLVVTNVLTLSALVLLYNKFVWTPVREENGKITLGIQVDPWRVGSLKGISESERAQFAKIYDDNRRIFGDGQEQPEPLTKHTKPFEYQALRGVGAVLTKENIKKLVSTKVIPPEPMRNLGNLQKLFLAVEEIRQQGAITSWNFKSVLQLRKRVMNNVPVIKNYGERFALSKLEKSTLKNAMPQETKDAKRNNRNRKKRNDLIIFHPSKKQKRHKSGSALLFFTGDVSRYDMYTEGSTINNAVADLSKLGVLNFDITTTQREFLPVLDLRGHHRVFMTPGKYSRTQEIIPNHRHTNEDNRHTAEIAAFHLDRVLGFRRALPCVGRIFNITKDLVDHKHHAGYNKPIVNLNGHLCLKAHCLHCGDKVCGSPDMIEASIMPDMSVYNVTTWPYPWRQADELNDLATWETDTSFCDDIRLVPPYNKGRRLLDVIDLAIFDFLQGNLRRKVYQTFTQFGEDTFIHHINNSRGFGKSYRDEISILAPLYQCCNIRFSTFQTLLDFELGPSRLSDVMSTSLARDPVAPVVLDQHLLALDRRLRIILKMVYECIGLNGAAKVLILDGF